MRNASTFAQLLVSSLAYLSGNIELGLDNPYVKVDTVQGVLRGAKGVARNGRVYAEFLGIPYAQPPIGELRFEPPEPPKNWSGVRDATNFGRSCLQYEYLTHVRTGHEDCLTLNVYTPQLSPLNRLPVVVFIHAGFYMSGFAYIYRPKYFMEEDVVLVTINYRVNSFGFLSTGDHVVRGNMGLKDQVMALRWVQQNIARFGGDPSRVTLMGQSAGGVSAEYHLVSPMSSGLFHRAIIQSGSIFGNWAFVDRAYAQRQAHDLARYLDCPTGNSTAMVGCMKSRSAYDIERYHRAYLDPVPDKSTIFRASAEAVRDENTFLPDSPQNLVRRGAIPNRVPVIIGVNQDEGHFGTMYLRTSGRKRYTEVFNDPKSMIRSAIIANETRPEAVQRILDYYFNNGTYNHYHAKPEAVFERQLTKFLSDVVFRVPAHRSVGYLAQYMPAVYPYFFTYAGERGVAEIQKLMATNPRSRLRIPKVLDFAVGAPRKWWREHAHTSRNADSRSPTNIVSHADELVYLFNVPVIADEITPGTKYYDFSREFVRVWVSFARDGKPSPFNGVEWSPVPLHKKSNPEYLDISHPPAMIPNPFEESVKFWNSLDSE